MALLKKIKTRIKIGGRAYTIRRMSLETGLHFVEVNRQLMELLKLHEKPLQPQHYARVLREAPELFSEVLKLLLNEPPVQRLRQLSPVEAFRALPRLLRMNEYTFLMHYAKSLGLLDE